MYCAVAGIGSVVTTPSQRAIPARAPLNGLTFSGISGEANDVGTDAPGFEQRAFRYHLSSQHCGEKDLSLLGTSATARNNDVLVY
jgi:hypothetical protein